MRFAGNTSKPLHTSKRMHFIEEWRPLTVSVLSPILAYVKTYALH